MRLRPLVIAVLLVLPAAPAATAANADPLALGCALASTNDITGVVMPDLDVQVGTMTTTVGVFADYADDPALVVVDDGNLVIDLNPPTPDGGLPPLSVHVTCELQVGSNVPSGTDSVVITTDVPNPVVPVPFQVTYVAGATSSVYVCTHYEWWDGVNYGEAWVDASSASGVQCAKAQRVVAGHSVSFVLAPSHLEQKVYDLV